jgi:hypothetical protein
MLHDLFAIEGKYGNNLVSNGLSAILIYPDLMFDLINRAFKVSRVPLELPRVQRSLSSANFFETFYNCTCTSKSVFFIVFNNVLQFAK